MMLLESMRMFAFKKAFFSLALVVDHINLVS